MAQQQEPEKPYYISPLRKMGGYEMKRLLRALSTCVQVRAGTRGAPLFMAAEAYPLARSAEHKQAGLVQCVLMQWSPEWLQFLLG